MLRMISTFFTILISASFVYADANQVRDFGFGLTPDELVAQGYKSVVKSSGNHIYQKQTEHEFKKIVSLKNEYVTTAYKNDFDTYFQYTKLDDEGNVLGMAECKFQGGVKSTLCDVQTTEICHELIEKIETGGFGFDLKKIQECADLSSKISYNRKSVDAFLPEVQKNIGAIYPGMHSAVVKAPAVSLQTLLKDYAACKKVKGHLAKPAGSAAATKDSATAKKATQ
ncbi:hypothetical protein [Bdellovibrio sp. HCB288]|uniref:hypothetical protein n=1 Tax=Bdellovibrio sp. HCB288 TaxID=3394355 RepID=UPI0039B5ECF6